MKRVFMFLAAMSLWACDSPMSDNFNGDYYLEKQEIDVEALIEEGYVDDVQLMDLLLTKGVEIIHAKNAEGEMSNETYINHRMVFTEDGICNRMKYEEDVMIIDPNCDWRMIVGDVGGCAKCGKHVYMSRDWRWSYDKENNMLTTEDDYGRVCQAEIIFANEAYMAYRGDISAEDDTWWRGCGDEYVTLVKFIDDRTSWQEDAVSYDIHKLFFIDPETDKRWQEIEQLLKLDSEVDDEAFVKALTEGTMYLKNEILNTEAGCCYGLISSYYCIDGIMRWSDNYVGGLTGGTYVMFEDGTARWCYTLEPFYMPPLCGADVYVDYKWEYDATSNTLYTGLPDMESAEVLYFGGNVAILKGYICRDYTPTSEYMIYYVDFNKFDREETLERYSTNYRDIVNW